MMALLLLGLACGRGDLVTEVRVGLEAGLEPGPCSGRLEVLGETVPLQFKARARDLWVAQVRTPPAQYGWLSVTCQGVETPLVGVFYPQDRSSGRLDLWLHTEQDEIVLTRVPPGMRAGTRPWAEDAWQIVAAVWGLLMLVGAGLLRGRVAPRDQSEVSE